MENTRIILDTNIFIEHLRKQHKQKSFLTKLAYQYTFSTTSISIYELLSGAKSLQHKNDIENLLFGINIIFFNRKAAEIAAEQRFNLLRQNKQFEIRDILIAGIVLNTGLPLATLNEKHFIAFEGIKLIQLQ